MEGDSLYSIKWYKGKREFYRYTPKEPQSIKTFPVAGISVETTSSNDTQVVISQVDTNISGKFSCEVSADAPHFNTMLVSGDMQVVEIPDAKPFIDGIMTRYRPGDELKENCTSQFSKPAANLSWTVNDVLAPASQLIIYKLSRNDSNLESTILGIHFPITQQHFVRGKLKLKCTAKIHEIYQQTEERVIEEVRPKILATGTSNMNMYHSVYDGEQLTDPNVGMTHYK
ncbi:CLUMA_CG014254, isoform A, partial [Clunio marinus]